MRASAVIAEDETVLREELASHLAALWPELLICGQACSGVEALRLIEQRRPDVAFLDIEMPGLSGLEVARQCEGRCHVVFVTAYDAHAVAAFEQGAVDYVLKPYDVERLRAAVQRVRSRLASSPASLQAVLRELAGSGVQPAYLRWINASAGSEVRLVTVDEVCYFQADTKYTRLVTVDYEALIRRPLKDLQDELDPANFWPIHRSTIVNANAIAGVVRDLRGRLSVRLKQRPERLPVSDAHVHLFRQM